jgi:hypothetical protein
VSVSGAPAEPSLDLGYSPVIPGVVSLVAGSIRNPTVGGCQPFSVSGTFAG